MSLAAMLSRDALRAKSVRSTFALSLGTAAEKSLKFARIAILSRLLAPADIGTMAIVLSVVAILEAFSEVGMKQCIIQSDNASSKSFLGTAFWVQIVRGTALTTIAIAFAPFIAKFYANSKLTLLLQVSFLVIFFRAAINPAFHLLERKYKFGTVAFVLHGCSILSTIFTILLALQLKNVWVLVIGHALEIGLIAILSYFVTPPAITLKLDKGALKEIFSFARGMLGVAALTAISFKMDVFVLGKMVDSSEIAIYTLALTLTQLPIELFAKIVNPILLPSFVHKKADPAALKAMLFKLTSGISIISVPFILCIVLFSKELVIFSFSEKYLAATTLVIILAARILARLQGLVFSSFYMALGKPQLHRYFTSLRAAILAVTIVPFIAWLGTSGAAWSIVLSNYIPLILQIAICRKILSIGYYEYAKQYALGLALSLQVFIFYFITQITGLSPYITLVLAITSISLSSLFSGLAVMQGRPNILRILTKSTS